MSEDDLKIGRDSIAEIRKGLKLGFTKEININNVNLEVDKILAKKTKEEKEEKEENIQGNGKKYYIKGISGIKIVFYNYFGRIEKDKAVLEFSLEDGYIYKVVLFYKISEDLDLFSNKLYSEGINIRDIKVKKFNNKKGKNEWVKKYYDYRSMNKIVSIILNDTNFNKHMIIKKKDI